ncbi:MAG: glycosyl transferase, partial [Deltaproteobacteria bacterium]
MVTITDHNTIEGALAIAHMPDVFVSEEVTTYFPEDGCKIHILALNITEKQHRDIQRVRPSIYDLAAYLINEKIVHVVAHPLYSTDDLMAPDHFEKLLLLFKNFELNGARDEIQNRMLVTILDALKPNDIERMAEKHGIDPHFPEPWKKNLTGGSDDHSSLNIARRYTEVSRADHLDDFMEGLCEGRCQAHGSDATPLTLSYTLYAIAYQFYKNKMGLARHVEKEIFLRFLDNFLTNHPHHSGVKARLYFFIGAHRHSKPPRKTEGIEKFLRHETQTLVLTDPTLLSIAQQGTRKKAHLDTKWFEVVRHISNKTLRQSLDRFLENLSGANVFDIFGSLGSAGALYSLLAPYFLSFSLFARDREVAEAIGSKLIRMRVKSLTDTSLLNVAHFTDTFYEINGVAATLQQQVNLAKKGGKHLTVITCEEKTHADTAGVKNFAPIGVHHLPEYPEQKLFYPPFLDMLRFCYENKF